MRVYLINARCRRCGKGGVALHQVWYDDGQAQRRVDGPFCEACARYYVLGGVDKQESEPSPIDTPPADR